MIAEYLRKIRGHDLRNKCELIYNKYKDLINSSPVDVSNHYYVGGWKTYVENAMWISDELLEGRFGEIFHGVSSDDAISIPYIHSLGSLFKYKIVGDKIIQNDTYGKIPTSMIMHNVLSEFGLILTEPQMRAINYLDNNIGQPCRLGLLVRISQMMSDELNKKTPPGTTK